MEVRVTEHTATGRLLGKGCGQTATDLGMNSILPPMSKHDLLVRLLSTNLRHYSRDPSMRTAAARNMLLYAFALYVELTTDEDALDAVTSALTLQEAEWAA